jgi:hypothetical protein
MHFTFRAASAAIAGLCLASAAHAALGGAPSSAGALHPGVAASVTTQAASGYAIDITTFSDGLIVHEYVANGTVFAATWRGPSMPNLTELFGSYYAQMRQGVSDYRRVNGGLTMAVVDQPTLHVVAGGRIGGFAGQAYLPNALPAGVAPAAIQ